MVTIRNRGFSLIEMMVSIALFAIVVMVATGALLSLVATDKKAQAIQSVLGNLNIALDGMVRSIRMGTNYHCGQNSQYSATADCPNGAAVLAIEPYGGNTDNPGDQWVYAYVPPSGSAGGYIEKSEDSGNTWFRLTAAEVSIDDMKFYVVGTARGAADTAYVQPKVVITVKGTANASDIKAATTFNIQATAVQRVLDI